MLSLDGVQVVEIAVQRGRVRPNRVGWESIRRQRRLSVRKSGKGIQRSDPTLVRRGRKSSLISEPIGRVAPAYKGTACWLAKEGLLDVGTNGGEKWSVQGKPVDASIGPYIDLKNTKRIVVAGAKGIFRSNDGGESWNLVAKLPPGLEKMPKAGWYANVAWDSVHDVFYASLMGKPTFRLEGGK